jgi:hypothetical protein
MNFLVKLHEVCRVSRTSLQHGEDCPELITNTDPHSIGTVGVVGSGGVVSTVVVLEDVLEKGEKGDEGQHHFSDGNDDDEDADHMDHTKFPKEVVHLHTPTKRSHTSPVWEHLQCIGNNFAIHR